MKGFLKAHAGIFVQWYLQKPLWPAEVLLIGGNCRKYAGMIHSET